MNYTAGPALINSLRRVIKYTNYQVARFMKTAIMF